MKTQKQLAESARRRAARKAQGISDILATGHGPTADELERLRKKRPGLWNGFPDVLEDEGQRDFSAELNNE